MAGRPALFAACLLATTAAFGGLKRDTADKHDAAYVETEAPAAFTDAATKCRAAIRSTLGSAWMSCVVDELLCASPSIATIPHSLGSPDRRPCPTPRSIAQKEPPEGVPPLPFSVVPHTFDPIAPDPMHKLDPGYHSSDRLRFLMRDFSCDSHQGGTDPLRSFEWTFHPPDPCEEASGAESDGAAPGYVYRGGFLPAGAC